MNNIPSDPVLCDAMAHIKQYLKERNIGGCISLSSLTHGEFGIAVPEWAALTLTPEHIQIHAGKDKDLMNCTAHFIYSQRDILVNYASMFAFLVEQVEKKIKEKGGEIEHTLSKIMFRGNLWLEEPRKSFTALNVKNISLHGSGKT